MQTGASRTYLKPKIDLVFKALFAREESKGILHSMLSSMLDLDIPSPEDIVLVNNESIEMNVEDKSSRFDVRVRTSDGVHVDIEIQMQNKQNMIKRSLYYTSKLFVSQLSAGDKYDKLGRAVALNYVNFNIFADERWHHRARMLDVEDKSEMSDCLEVNFVELKKLSGITAQGMDLRLLWAHFINAESKEEFDMLSEQNMQISNAVNQLGIISADSSLRYQSEMREKSMRDQADEILYAKNQGEQIGIIKGEQIGIAKEREQTARVMKAKGFAIEVIAEITGLCDEEINKI